MGYVCENCQVSFYLSIALYLNLSSWCLNSLNFILDSMTTTKSAAVETYSFIDPLLIIASW